MGKALIIKGADFSEVAIGVKKLTLDNVDDHGNHYISESNVWRSGDSLFEGCYYKVNQGDVVSLYANDDYPCIFALLKDLKEIYNGNTPHFMEEYAGRIIISKGQKGEDIEVPQTGFLYILGVDQDLEPSPNREERVYFPKSAKIIIE